MPKSHSILLRKAHVSEARTIATMSRLQIEHGLTWRWTAAKMKQRIRDESTRVQVATREGVIVGFAMLTIAELDAHLLLLAVEHQHRRMGVGRALVSAMENLGRAAGSNDVRLEVRAENRAAVQFYEQLGYRSTGLVPAYYDRGESAIAMRRSIGADADSQDASLA